jgi:hypothetical protein
MEQNTYLIPVNGQLVCFRFEAMTNKVAMNMCAHVSVHNYVFISLVYITKGRNAGSYDNTLCLNFEELSNCFPKQLHYFMFIPAVV